MTDSSRSKNGFLTFLILLFILFFSLPQAHALQSFLDDFNATYGTADTRLDQCSTCHISNTNFNLNPYGADFLNAGSFEAIESLDSDGDGFTNIAEITALTFPGDPNDFPAPVNQPPVADPNGPYSGTVGTPVQFDGSASSDVDGTIVSYDWDFGDGMTGTGAMPTHTYTTDGTFTVTLTVTDDAGATGTATTTATIGLGNQAPVADPNGPYTGTVDAPVQFDGSGSSDPDGTIVSYSWDFGDGTTGTGVNPTHTYTMAGVFNVTLTVMDDAGATDSAGTTATIGEIVNQPPMANANGPYSGTTGVPVMFDGTASTDSDGTIVSYDWDFGDGTTMTDAGPTPSHTYLSDGIFTVTLTVTDDAGATGMDTTTATIGPVANQPPMADADGPYSGTVDSPVQFDGTGSTDPDGTIVSYSWDFGDGATGTGATPTHTYTATGTFTVTLTVTDDADASDSDTTTATIGIGNQPPTANANGPYTGTVDMPVQFDGSGSSDPEDGPLTYTWDFGDGNVGAGVSPTHTYTTAGTYNVTLTVTDDAGATDSDMTTATIVDVTPPPDGNVDLDIDEFDVDRRYRLGDEEGIEIELKVINNGTGDQPRTANVTGFQRGKKIYQETMSVSAPVGGDQTQEFEFPPFIPSKVGAIIWKVTIADNDPDMDWAWELTIVKPPRPDGEEDEEDDEGENG